MRKDTLINLRINQETKEMFQEIVEGDGFTMSEVLQASMNDVIMRGKVPLYLTSKIKKKRQPNITIPLIKEYLEHLLSKDEKVKSASLFGSYAKGTATASSDIDLFLDLEDDYTLFELGDLQQNLEKMTGKKVDITTRTDDDFFINHIQKEKITLYEKR